MSDDGLEAGVEVPLALLTVAPAVHVVAGGAARVLDLRVPVPRVPTPTADVVEVVTLPVLARPVLPTPRTEALAVGAPAPPREPTSGRHWAGRRAPRCVKGRVVCVCGR